VQEILVAGWASLAIRYITQQAHARLLEMLDEQGIQPWTSRPIFNAEHVQWMVRERHCVALIRESDPFITS
jgi:hypothetical protein